MAFEALGTEAADCEAVVRPQVTIAMTARKRNEGLGLQGFRFRVWGLGSQESGEILGMRAWLRDSGVIGSPLKAQVTYYPVVYIRV